MIKSFSHQEAEEVFHGIHSHALRKLLPANLYVIAERRLDILNCAESLESLRMIPAFKGEASVRDAHGKYSIPIYGNWRIAFRWDKDSPADVEIKT